ncbi:MAG: hypothetical protein ACW99G_05585 [Candidatus Thorarchaeota archaeon]|jgi:hypothetical protein
MRLENANGGKFPFASEDGGPIIYPLMVFSTKCQFYSSGYHDITYSGSVDFGVWQSYEVGLDFTNSKFRYWLDGDQGTSYDLDNIAGNPINSYDYLRMYASQYSGRDMWIDNYFVRKWVNDEPYVESIGDNVAPEIKELDCTDPYGSDDIPITSEKSFQVCIEDENGYADINYVKMWFELSNSTVYWLCAYYQNTDTFSDYSSYIDVDESESSVVSSGNWLNVTFVIFIEESHPIADNFAIGAKVMDDHYRINSTTGTYKWDTIDIRPTLEDCYSIDDDDEWIGLKSSYPSYPDAGKTMIPSWKVGFFVNASSTTGGWTANDFVLLEYGNEWTFEYQLTNSSDFEDGTFSEVTDTNGVVTLHPGDCTVEYDSGAKTIEIEFIWTVLSNHTEKTEKFDIGIYCDVGQRIDVTTDDYLVRDPILRNQTYIDAFHTNYTSLSELDDLDTGYATFGMTTGRPGELGFRFDGLNNSLSYMVIVEWIEDADIYENPFSTTGTFLTETVGNIGWCQDYWERDQGEVTSEYIDENGTYYLSFTTGWPAYGYDWCRVRYFMLVEI